MLNKLLKYDFKSMFKSMIPMYIILILAALLNRCAHFASEKISLLDVPAGMITGLYIILLFGVPFASFIIGIVKYYNNLVKDEGYLMHTLPVKKSSLILSKLISSVTVIITSIMMSAIGLFVGCYNVLFGSDIFEPIKGMFESTDTLFIILMVLTVIVSLVFYLLMIYLSIALGQKKNSNRGVYSFVFGIVIYNVTQIVMSIILIVPMFLDSNLYKYMDEDIIPTNILNGYIGASLLLSVIVSVIYYIITKNIMKNKLNLE